MPNGLVNERSRAGRSRWFAIAAAFAFASTAGLSQHYAIDPSASEVHFSLGASDGTVNGSFRVTSGEFSLDPGTGAMTGNIAVDAGSGDSGNKKRDKKMTNEQMKAQTYATVTFAPSKFSGKVNETGDSSGQVEGTFTLIGQAHPISVPMSVHMESGRFTAAGEFTVPYVSWGMKDPSWFVLKVQKEVKVQLKLAGTVTK